MMEVLFDPAMMWLVLSVTFVYVLAYVMNGVNLSRFTLEYALEKQLDIATESRIDIPFTFIRQFLFVRRKRPCNQDHHSSDDEDAISLGLF